MRTKSKLLFTALLLVLLCGCTAIKPSFVPVEKFTTPHAFSHKDFGQMLQKFADKNGFVDYVGLKKDAGDIDRYYLLLATYSPDSHPALFPTEQSKLAYWLNAYNGAVIKTVLTHYPISSVEDITPPFPLIFLPNKTGFFLFQRVTFGGIKTSLYYLEKGVIRKRFKDPRIHFALNCAARGCPRLPMRPFTAINLDGELDDEARKFLAEKRNFKIDHQEKTIYLSSIFKWYEKDFLKWYREKYPLRKATLLNYVALYLAEKEAEELISSTDSYQVRFTPYDWRLNDKNKTD